MVSLLLLLLLLSLIIDVFIMNVKLQPMKYDILLAYNIILSHYTIVDL